MLRVHLTVGDLLKTRFASAPAPLVEIELAAAALQRQDPVFRGWRRSAAAQLPSATRPLLELIPPSATGPLFLDPITMGLAEGLELVQAAPASFVAAELRRVSGSRPPTPWLRSLAARDRETCRELDLALRLVHRHLLEDAWPRILSGFRSDLAWRSRLMAEAGVQAALSTLHPSISWNDTVMQIETENERDIYPDGAGLTLMPSALWAGQPLLARQPDRSVLVVYPAVTPLPLVDESSKDPLADLLGHTRAAVLRLTFTGCSTTDLARELGVSAATVSGHTKALRAAGLIVTARAGKAVHHSLTTLGDGLLDSVRRSASDRNKSLTCVDATGIQSVTPRLPGFMSLT
jgi:DNA-binding MarR family transcriptional regulator